MVDYKRELNNVYDFFKNPKVQNILVILLFLVTLFIGFQIRTADLPNLIDKTTGDYTPLALDPYYFLRVSETLLANDGVLPAVDTMRYQALNSGWTTELLPHTTVWIYKAMKMFDSSVTLNFADVMNPVVFFVLGLIIFFILSWVLIKKRWIALIASMLLTVIPPYLYRTLGGFSDHEAIGIFGVFLSLLFFYVGMNYLEKKNLSLVKSGLWGLLAGISTLFAIVGWGGGASFLFMILPIAFLIRWITLENKPYSNYVLFYFMWIIGVLFFAPIFDVSMISLIKKYMISTSGILTLFALGYSAIELVVNKYKIFSKKIKENSEITSILSIIVLGGILYSIFIGNFFELITHIIGRIIYPFGTGRVGLTVAENKQPYLVELIAQVGKTVFYTFLAGCAIVGVKIASGIRNTKFRPLFIGSFTFFIIGILFSRVSSTSVLNGTNFISKALFFISFLAIAISSIYIYKKSDWKINLEWLFIVAWMIPMLISVRSAIRVFFAIVPFIALVVPLAIFELFSWGRKNKDDFAKFILIIAAVIASILLIFAITGYYKTVKVQSVNQHPSYNSDWQNAMKFVRENTTESGIFLHWWDYGYWVQTGGNRPTLTDGGHFNGYWDHLVGRYVLTTPNPDTAKSFMKSQNISYLLIDPSDIGKYGAYSSIGTGKDNDDRSAWLSTLISDQSQTQETRNGTIRIYQGGSVLDSDIVYIGKAGNVFLPARKAGIGAIIIEKTEGGYNQPIGVYVYNNKQTRLPLRYLYINGKLIDFESGVNSTAYVYPNVVNQKFDLEGAVMYLSEKSKDSLVAKLYLMNDPEKDYSELGLEYAGGSYPFPFYYQGFRGPIKIWSVGDLSKYNNLEEFRRPSGEFGEFDDLQFVK